jgi:integrase
MARPRSTNKNLPTRLVAIRAKGRAYYYYDQGAASKPRYKPLGTDYIDAVRQWADLEGGNAKMRSVFSFEDAARKYESVIIPTKSTRTQIDYQSALKFLRQFFDGATLADIQPIHVAQFREWRKGVQANRNIAVLSSLWNHAREWGMTDRANPCEGVKRNAETGRDVYLTDEQVDRVASHGPRTLQLAIELAYLTGQRPADVLKMRETDIRDGYIQVRQGKTGTPVRIAVVGRLAELVAECRAAKSGTVVNTALIVGDHGKPISVQWLSILWKRARVAAGITDDIQFRDLRAKAVSDKEDATGNIRDAQALAGHSTVSMTEHYSRKRRGQKVEPTR